MILINVDEVTRMRHDTEIAKRLFPKKYREGLLFAAPTLIGLVLFFIIPFIFVVIFSFTKGLGTSRFVGLSNYIDVFKSSAFLLAATNTLKFLAVSIPAIIIVSFIIAITIHNNLNSNKFYRTILLFPLVLPIASLVMLVHVFFSQGGIINTWLSYFGYNEANWLTGPSSFWILVAIYIWKFTGYNVILFLSGLNMIFIEYYQIADIEGATTWDKFRWLTLPLMRNSLFFTVVISIINSFKIYREAFMIAGKHPNDSIYFLQHFLINNFENLNYQRLSVAALFLFALIFLILFFYYSFNTKNEDD